MPLHDVKDTLGAVLVGSGCAAVFVIISSLGDCTGLTSKDWSTQLNRGCHRTECALLQELSR